MLLLIKIGFGKSLIFQFFPFLSATLGVVLTLLPLKLLQVEQSEKINLLPERKYFVLNRKNNTNSVLVEIANGEYIYVFSSPKIALSKKFKQFILDSSSFIKHFCLLVVDKIYLFERWNKNFQPIYAKIKKI